MGERPSGPMKKDIKHEQGCRCGMCQQLFEERDLFVHHIKPVGHFTKKERRVLPISHRENLIALCDPCHTEADRLAFEEGTYIREIPIFLRQNDRKKT